jgi:hypothetical protein
VRFAFRGWGTHRLLTPDNYGLVVAKGCLGFFEVRLRIKFRATPPEKLAFENDLKIFLVVIFCCYFLLSSNSLNVTGLLQLKCHPPTLGSNHLCWCYCSNF